MIERTLVMIKPAHFDKSEEILRELDSCGQRVKTTRVDSVPRDVIENHYSGHREKFYFAYMVKHFEGRSVMLAIYEGKDIIKKIGDAVGPTDPAKANRNTIRGRYSRDSLEKAIGEGRAVNNVVHRSDSPSEAKREIDVWKAYLS